MLSCPGLRYMSNFPNRKGSNLVASIFLWKIRLHMRESGWIDYVEISVLLGKFECQTWNLNMGWRGVINTNFVILITFSSLSRSLSRNGRPWLFCDQLWPHFEARCCKLSPLMIKNSTLFTWCWENNIFISTLSSISLYMHVFFLYTRTISTCDACVIVYGISFSLV